MDDETPQQRALEEAQKILDPYFDAWVIVGRFSRDERDRTLDSVRHRRHGAFTEVRGLIEVYRDTLKNENDNTPDR